MANADTTPPVLTSLTLPGTIDLTNGAAAAVFSAAATDVGSGVARIFALLDHAYTTVAGPQSTLAFSGAASTLSQTFSAGSSSGVYTVTVLAVYDNAGNVALYTAAQLLAMHLATTFTLTGGTGTGATGFTGSGYNIGTSTGSGTPPPGLSATPTVVGTTGADALTAHAGDIVYGGAGNDIIIGGSGATTALYTGTLSGYSVSQSGSTVTVSDATSGRDGVDTLTSVSQARFSDYTLVFDLSSAQDKLVYEIYQAAYGRTPDNAGFRYWAAQADPQAHPEIGLADAFLAAPEFTQVYGTNPNNTTYINELYTHVLGRTPDQAGLTYWIGQANSGQPRDQLLVDFAVSPEDVQLVGAHTSNGFLTT